MPQLSHKDYFYYFLKLWSWKLEQPLRMNLTIGKRNFSTKSTIQVTVLVIAAPSDQETFDSVLSQKAWVHYKKTVLRPRFKNAAIGPKNAAVGPFGLRPRFLRPRFIPRPKTCDYRPVKSKAALNKWCLLRGKIHVFWKWYK